MKKILTFLTALILTTSAYAQPPRFFNSGDPRTYHESTQPNNEMKPHLWLYGSTRVNAVAVFKVEKMLVDVQQRVTAGVEACVPVVKFGPFPIQRFDFYQDLRPTALVVSYPYPTDMPDFFFVKIEAENQTHVKVTVLYNDKDATNEVARVKQWISGNTSCSI